MISSTLSPTFVPKASLTDWKSLTSRSSSAYFGHGRRDLRGRLQPRQELGPIEHSMRVVTCSRASLRSLALPCNPSDTCVTAVRLLPSGFPGSART